MDATSTSTTVFTCMKAVGSCSMSIYAFMDDVIIVDETIILLQDQVDALQRSLSELDSSLRSATSQALSSLPHWCDINDAILDCQHNITAVEHRFTELCSSSGKQEPFMTAHQDYRAEEMARLRAQVQSHRMAMQTVQQIITVHVSSCGPDVVTHVLKPQLAQLLKLVQNLNLSAFAFDSEDATVRPHEKLEQSAKTVACTATAIVGANSTSWSGSQPDMDRHATPTALKRRTTIGSERGQPLSPGARKRISRWMAMNPDANAIKAMPPMADHPAFARREESPVNPEPAYTVSTSSMGDGSQDSDDDETGRDIALEIAQKCLSAGRARAVSCNYAQAEAFLRKGLEKIVALGSNPEISKADVELEIAAACFEQDKLASTLQLLDGLRRPTADHGEEVVLSASHLRAQVYLRQGLYGPAVAHCKRAIKGRKRLSGKDQPYLESVSLMASIYRAMGDEIEAFTYGSLLPSSFTPPTFKQPDLSLRAPKRPKERRLTDLSSIDSVDSRCRPSTSGALRETMINGFVNDDLRSDASTPTSVSATSSITNGSRASTELTSHTRNSSDGEAAAKIPLPLQPRPASTPPMLTLRHVSEPIFGSNHDYSISRTSTVMKPVIPSPKTHHYTAALGTQPLPATAPSFGPQQVASSRLSTLYDGDENPSVNGVVDKTRATPAMPIEARIAALRLLEQSGVTLNATRDWRNQFFFAATLGYHTVVQLLLTDWQYQKPSVIRRSKEAVLHKAVPIDSINDRRQTALHLASISGHAKVVQLLLTNGASHKLRMQVDTSKSGRSGTIAGQTALECAITEGHADVAEVYLDLGCFDSSADHQGWTLLHHAAFRGEAGLFQKLVDRRLRVEAKSTSGKTPLHIAAQKGNYQVAKLLLFHGADRESRDHCGSTPLMLATAGGHQQCVDLLLTAGSDVQATDLFGASGLHIAAREGHAVLIPTLAEKSADLQATDARLRTPLHYAAQAGQVMALRQLLDLGANAQAQDDDGNTALHHGAECGHHSVVEMLVLHGANVDLFNSGGRTALSLAAQHGHRAALLALIADTTDLEAADRSGWTALSYANANGHTQVAKLLQLNGAKT